MGGLLIGIGLGAVQPHYFIDLHHRLATLVMAHEKCDSYILASSNNFPIN